MKKYKISRDYWECLVEIDEDFKIEGMEDYQIYNPEGIIRSMVEFWHGWDSRISDNDDDYTKTFLQQLAREIQYIMLEHNCNLKGVLSAFEQREGWFNMDGSYGIKITFIDDLEIEHREFEVEEVTA